MKRLLYVAGSTLLFCCGIAVATSVGLLAYAAVNQAGPSPVPEAAYRLPQFCYMAGSVGLLLLPAAILGRRYGAATTSS